MIDVSCPYERVTQSLTQQIYPASDEMLPVCKSLFQTGACASLQKRRDAYCNGGENQGYLTRDSTAVQLSMSGMAWASRDSEEVCVRSRAVYQRATHGAPSTHV